MGILRGILIALGSKSALKAEIKSERRRIQERRRKAREWDRYRTYLESKTWKKKRKAVLQRDGRKCQHCGAKATQVHHKQYAEKKGTEPMEWLEAICNSCHRRLHGRSEENWYW